MSKVVIIMGSKSDLDWSLRIAKSVSAFGIAVEMRVASAHKVPLVCLDVIKKSESANPVFITVAGRSNALSAFADAQTHCPVIACPPYGDKFAGNDIYSSLRMPSGVAPMVVLDPENAALAAAKIMAFQNPAIADRIMQYQQQNRQQLMDDDGEVLSL
ncbi:MAG: AIR carboxylase family protein [Marinilabiliaceae bacterium]|nr:AIR carboxylase family protein [Marinilabiliaceae bacterium]